MEEALLIDISDYYSSCNKGSEAFWNFSNEMSFPNETTKARPNKRLT